MTESVSLRREERVGRKSMKKRGLQREREELANNLFSFSLDRHIRQHLYRFVDYANTKGGVGDIEKNNNNMKEKKNHKSAPSFSSSSSP